MNKTLIIFDMDGTLVDTSEGILNCHKFAHEAFGRTPPSDGELRAIIGGPLLKTYTDRFAMPIDLAKQAVTAYRKHYAEVGFDQCVEYDGMTDLLRSLKQKGYLLGIATLKADHLARKILDKLSWNEYFDVVHGVDVNDTLTKADLILACANDLNVPLAECLLVGDSAHDSVGAGKAGVDFLAVTYGFGFQTKEEVARTEKVGACASPKQIDELLPKKRA